MGTVVIRPNKRFLIRSKIPDRYAFISKFFARSRSLRHVVNVTEGCWPTIEFSAIVRGFADLAPFRFHRAEHGFQVSRLARRIAPGGQKTVLRVGQGRERSGEQ